MKLSAKFARQEGEETRLARIARRRVSEDRAGAIRRMLGLPENRNLRMTDEARLRAGSCRALYAIAASSWLCTWGGI
jgi:hypothetical protein